MVAKYLSGIAIALMFFCQQVSAFEAYGGRLRASNGDSISARCQTQDTAIEDCQSFFLYLIDKKTPQKEFLVGGITTEEIEESAAAAEKLSHKKFEAVMRNVYVVPTAATLLLCLSKVYFFCPVVAPIAVLDIVKVPLVLTVHGILEIKDVITHNRFIRYLNFLLDPQKKGMIKRIKRRDFEAIMSAT